MENLYTNSAIDKIRAAFEEVAAPNFFIGESNMTRNTRGEYIAESLEDHWQTFQEGWECAITAMQHKANPNFSDIVSDGRFDPRS